MMISWAKVSNCLSTDRQGQMSEFSFVYIFLSRDHICSLFHKIARYMLCRHIEYSLNRRRTNSSVFSINMWMKCTGIQEYVVLLVWLRWAFLWWAVWLWAVLLESLSSCLSLSLVLIDLFTQLIFLHTNDWSSLQWSSLTLVFFNWSL
jgi:hypothetical protein